MRFPQVSSYYVPMFIPSLIIFYETPAQQMKIDLLDVPKLLLIFAINTWEVYVSISLYIIWHVQHGNLHERINAFHERGRHRFLIDSSMIHMCE
jgi:hypothetical protein